MTALAQGSEFPKEVQFPYVPYDPESASITACGFPITLNMDKEIANKKVVIVAVPGAFTPTCMANHIPPYGEKLSQLKSKGVDEVIVLSANDPFVQSAWGKAMGLFDKIKFVTDPEGEFSKLGGLANHIPKLGLGTRTGRYALIVDNGKVTYLGAEEDPSNVEKSSADAVLAHL